MDQRLGYQLPPATAIQWEVVDDHLGWHPQGDGRWYLGVYVENGRIKDSEDVTLKTGFRRLVETFRPGIRLTPQQNILFTDIAEEHKPAVNALLRDHNIAQLSEISNALRYAMACPALPTCGLAMSDAERALPSVVRGLEREKVDLASHLAAARKDRAADDLLSGDEYEEEGLAVVLKRIKLNFIPLQKSLEAGGDEERKKALKILEKLDEQLNEVLGKGDTKTVASNAKPEGRAMNRRVEFAKI